MLSNLSVTKLKISFNAEGLHEASLNEEQKVTIYRIVQEQLNNVLKHAQASSVNIQLNTAGDHVNLLIEDNGKGFDTNAQRKGIGITNIISRAELFNGKVKIDSSPGNGCRLEVILDTKAHEAQAAA